MTSNPSSDQELRYRRLELFRSLISSYDRGQGELPPWDKKKLADDIENMGGTKAEDSTAPSLMTLFRHLYTEGPWPYSLEEARPWQEFFREGEDPTLFQFLAGLSLGNGEYVHDPEASLLHYFLFITRDISTISENAGNIILVLENFLIFLGKAFPQAIPLNRENFLGPLQALLEDSTDLPDPSPSLKEMEKGLKEQTYPRESHLPRAFYLMIRRILVQKFLSLDQCHKWTRESPLLSWMVLGINPLKDLLRAGNKNPPLPFYPYAQIWTDFLSEHLINGKELPFAEKLQIKILLLKLYQHQAAWEPYLNHMETTVHFIEEEIKKRGSKKGSPGNLGKIAERILRSYSRQLFRINPAYFLREPEITRLQHYARRLPQDFHLHLAIYRTSPVFKKKVQLKTLEKSWAEIKLWEGASLGNFISSLPEAGSLTARQSRLKKIFFDKMPRELRQDFWKELSLFIFLKIPSPVSLSFLLTLYKVYDPKENVFHGALLSLLTKKDLGDFLKVNGPHTAGNIMIEAQQWLYGTSQEAFKGLFEKLLFSLWQTLSGEFSPLFPPMFLQHFLESLSPTSFSLLSGGILKGLKTYGDRYLSGQNPPALLTLMDALEKICPPHLPLSFSLQELRSAFVFRSLNQNPPHLLSKKGTVQLNLWGEKE